MRVGLNLPQYTGDFAGGTATARRVIEIARAAEESGIDSVWLSDHPFAVAPDGTVWGGLEPLVMLGALARATARVRVGTLALAATMRLPALVAHAARAMASAAPERVVLGLGTGWYEPEHRAYGVALPPFAARVARLEASVSALAALDAGPRLLVAGSSRGVLDAAGRYADEWNTAWNPSTDAFRTLSRRLDEACQRAGRDPRDVVRSVGLEVLVAPDEKGLEDAVRRLRERGAFLAGVTLAGLRERIIVGTPAACADRIAAYAADEAVVTLLLRDDAEMIGLLGREVAPAVRTLSR